MAKSPASDPVAASHRPVRVLRIIARLNIGGPARHAVILNDGLRRLGWETLLVYGASSPAEGSMDHLARERQLQLAFVPFLGRRISAVDDLRAFWHILQLIRRTRPDVVHTHTAKAGTLGRLAAVVYNATSRRQARCAIIHTFHGHVFEGYFGPLGTHATRVTERLLSIVTDRIIAISERQRHDLVERFRIAPAARVTTTALGLELDDLLRLPDREASRQALGLRHDDVVVGYVGRLAPIKQVDLLIRACAIARERIPSLQLVVAGDGETRPALAGLAAALGISGMVHFLGWRHDLASLYASLDVFAMTSANEGTPVALIEALAAGVPVAVTAVGGVPDVVDSSPQSILVYSSDPADVAAAIVRAAGLERRAHASAARSAIVERFGAKRLATDIAAIYETVLSRRRGAAVTRSLP